MTREEFIDRYVTDSKLDPECKTEFGFHVEDRSYIALSCTCGDELCWGWAMIPNNEADVAWHKSRNAPEETP